MTRERPTIDCDHMLAELAAGRHVALLVGPAGAGKSWLAQAMLGRLVAQGAVGGYGKYADADDQSAYAPIVAALSDAVAAALDRQFDPQRALASLTDALGVHFEVLLAIGLKVPGVNRASVLQALADRRQWSGRISAAVIALLAWFDDFSEQPALLIDDWDRAPPDAAALLAMIANAALRRSAILILTGRTAGAVDALPGGKLVRRELGPRDDAAVAAMLADALGGPAAAAAVIERLGDALPRLPFDIVQLAEAARHAGWLIPCGRGWTIDPDKHGPLAYQPADRIAALSPVARKAALALALIGDGVQADVLRNAFEPRYVDVALAELSRAGIIAMDGGRLAFRHDRLREAAFAAGGDQAQLAAAMAERLHASDGDATIALTLRLAGELETADPARWRARFAQAATVARGTGDAKAADRFAEAALALAGRGPANDRAEQRTILREAMLAAASRDDPRTRERAAALVASAQTHAERFGDSELAITALRFAGDAEGAWRMLCDGLASVGVRLPERAGLRQLLPAMLAWRLRNRGARRSSRLRPELVDAFTGMATAAATTAYHRDPALTALIGFRASVLVGRDARTRCYWHGVDAFLHGVAGSPSRAAAAGERALALFAEQPHYRAQSLYQAVFFGTLWTQRLADARPRFREVTQIALAEGDPTMAAYGLRADIIAAWRSERDLPTQLEQARIALRSLTALGEQSFVDEMASLVALLEGMTGVRPWKRDLWRTDLPARNHVIDLELSNLVGDWRGTLRLAKAFAPLARDYRLQHEAILLRFHAMLATLRCDRPVSRGDMRYLEQAARLNPHDHRTKLLLIVAERERLAGRPCQDAYAAALTAAEAADARLIAGLTAQCAADAMEERGDAELAARYARRAAAIWRAWGLHPQARGANAVAVAEIAARADAAERADRAKSRLLAHVGHELRTPLQALQAQLDLTADGGRPLDPATLRDLLSSLNAVVDDLDLIGDQPGRAEHAGDCVDLADLVRSEMALWPGLDVKALEADPALPAVALPANRVRQIVRNLLSNAVKYGGGAATIALSHNADPPSITLSVTDRGPGIPPGLLDTIFAPFERGTHQGDGRGTGLGLALSRRIAERLGGTLTAHNDRAGGASFVLSLPASPAVATTAAPGPAAALELLLVEDTDLIRQAVAALLQRAGHRVVETNDAASALARLGRQTFDAVLLDVGLPDASGLVVLDTVRRDHGPTPVVLLTAAVDRSLTDRVADDPATRVLRKPVSAEQLHAILGDLLGATSPPPAGAPPEYQRLKVNARREVRARGIRLARARRPDAAAAHQLAGLAAQFGWNDVALAAEAMDASAAAAARLRDAVGAMD